MADCRGCGARLRRKEYSKGHSYCSFCRNTIMAKMDGECSDDDLAGMSNSFLRRFSSSNVAL